MGKIIRVRLKGSTPFPVCCGVLPPGTGLHDYHAPPFKAHPKNVEGKYWKEFSQQVSDTFPVELDDMPLRLNTTSWNLASADALGAFGRQQLYFKALDRYQKDTDTGLFPASTKDLKDTDTGPLRELIMDLKTNFDKCLAKAFAQLPLSYQKTSTVVMEAAFSSCEKAF